MFLCGREWLMLKVRADCPSSRRCTSMPAASRHSECRPSAPTTSRAAERWPCRVRDRDRGLIRLQSVSASSSSRVRLAVRPRAPPVRRPACGFRCCSRTLAGRSPADENRTSGARIRRPVSSTRRIVVQARQPCRGSAARRRAVEEIDGGAEQRRGAVVGIGRAARDQRGPAPVCASAIAAESPAGPPPITAMS